VLELVEVQLVLAERGVRLGVGREVDDLDVDAGLFGLLLEDGPLVVLRADDADADGLGAGGGGLARGGGGLRVVRVAAAGGERGEERGGGDDGGGLADHGFLASCGGDGPRSAQRRRRCEGSTGGAG